MELHTGTHDVVHMWGMAFNMDTIYMTWVVFAIIIVVAFFATRQVNMVPSGVQNVVEFILETIGGQLKGPLGKHFSKVSSLLFYFLYFYLSK